MVCYILLLFFLLLFGATFCEPGEFQEAHFTKSYELPLRGFLTLVIVYHHLSQYLGIVSAFPIFWEIGTLYVSVFFFYSGYGLMKSAAENPAYFTHFFRRRYLHIFLPFFLCNLLYLAVYYAAGDRFSPSLFLQYLLGIRLINPQSWYILVIALFYLVFYLCFHLVHNRIGSLFLLLLFQLFYPSFCIIIGKQSNWLQGEWWFNTTFLFLIGVLTSQFEPIIMHAAKKYYTPLLVLATLSFFCVYPASVRICSQKEALLPFSTLSIKALSEPLLCFMWRTLAAFSFNFFLFLFTFKIRFSNPFLIFLGQHSLELYLSHGLFLELFRRQELYPGNDFLYTLFVLLFSLLSAWLLHQPFRLFSFSR